MIRGVIFDLDGVVADSHPLHEEAWRVLLSEQGLDPSTLDTGFIYSGLSRRDILEHYMGPIQGPDFERLGQRKDELFSGEIQRLRAQPGLLRVLDQLDAAGIPYALATSAGPERTYKILGRFGITHRFAVIVTNDDVTTPKPAPETFLLAASRLGFPPQEVIALEDSVGGVQAARAAGMICIGYARDRERKDLLDAGASDVVSDFPRDMMSYLQRLSESAAIPQPGE